jgi:A/G-specific adenine glycosylase
MHTRDKRLFQQHLFTWYRQYARDLPWRRLVDPYAIWVSEIMLQQTRVETVLPYFKTWMQAFPTITELAEASEQEVLSIWEGLGYYGRARNLHRAAGEVVRDHGGILPRDMRALRALPGIGRYTAGAIASIAYGMNEPVLDANVKRVYARIFDLRLAVNSPRGEKWLWETATDNLPDTKAGTFNQALMDLGASICLPRNPACSHCPVQEFCISNAKGSQDLRPVHNPGKETPHHIQAAGAILKAESVLLARRPSNGLLGGMWEFPNGRVHAAAEENLASALLSEYDLIVRPISRLQPVKHAYTHFKVTVHPFVCELVSREENKNLTWIKLDRLDEYPMGKVDRTIAGMIKKNPS